MEVSSTSMKVASMTEIAISQGLETGRDIEMPPAPAIVVLAIHSPAVSRQLSGKKHLVQQHIRNNSP
jgi:hypothetical protein